MTLGCQLGNRSGILDKSWAAADVAERPQSLRLAERGADKYQGLDRTRPRSNKGTPGRRMKKTRTTPATMPPMWAHHATWSG